MARGEPKPCCGSKGTRHLMSCEKAKEYAKPAPAPRVIQTKAGPRVVKSKLPRKAAAKSTTSKPSPVAIALTAVDLRAEGFDARGLTDEQLAACVQEARRRVKARDVLAEALAA